MKFSPEVQILFQINALYTLNNCRCTEFLFTIFISNWSEKDSRFHKHTNDVPLNLKNWSKTILHFPHSYMFQTQIIHLPKFHLILFGIPYSSSQNLLKLMTKVICWCSQLSYELFSTFPYTSSRYYYYMVVSKLSTYRAIFSCVDCPLVYSSCLELLPSLNFQRLS